MAFLTELWLPILLSSVFVFVLSSIFHMVLPYHKSEVSRIPNEDAVLAAMRDAGIGPGAYMFPVPEDMKTWGTEEMKEKIAKGPIGFLAVIPGWNMGRSLGLWFAQSLIIGSLIAYVAWESLGGAGVEYLEVFQVTGAIGVLGYAVGHMHDSIWKGVRWRCTAKFMFDGVVYALVTAGTFGWLWPSAAVTTGLPG